MSVKDHVLSGAAGVVVGGGAISVIAGVSAAAVSSAVAFVAGTAFVGAVVGGGAVVTTIFSSADPNIEFKRNTFFSSLTATAASLLLVFGAVAGKKPDQPKTALAEPTRLVQQFEGACDQIKLEQSDNGMMLTLPEGCVPTSELKPKAGT